jgi:hypothetical protein
MITLVLLLMCVPLVTSECPASAVGFYVGHVLPPGTTSSLGFSSDKIFSFDFSFEDPQPNLSSILRTSRFSGETSSFTVPVGYIRDITSTSLGTILIFSDGMISEVGVDGAQFRVVTKNTNSSQVFGGVYSPKRDVIFFLYNEGGLGGVARKTGIRVFDSPPSGHVFDFGWSSLAIDPVTDLLYGLFSDDMDQLNLIYWTFNMSSWNAQFVPSEVSCQGGGELRYGGCGSLAVTREYVYRTGPDYTYARSLMHRQGAGDVYFKLYIHDKVILCLMFKFVTFTPYPQGYSRHCCFSCDFACTFPNESRLWICWNFVVTIFFFFFFFWS